MHIKVPAMLIAALALAGCQHGADTGLPYLGGKDNFGEANRMTMAAQIIDPDPVYDTLVPETHGEHAGQAVERYRTDKVKKPDRTKTTDAIIDSGGGK